MGQVPDTTTFSMQDVVNAGVQGDDLVQLFANSTARGFDPAYEGDKSNLLNFRNYNNEPAFPIPYTETFDVNSGWTFEGGAFIDGGTLFLPGAGAKATCTIDQTVAFEVLFTLVPTAFPNSGTMQISYAGFGSTGSPNPGTFEAAGPVGLNEFYVKNEAGQQEFDLISWEQNSPVFPAGIVHAWKCNEGSGTSLVDSVDGSGNMTLVGNSANVWEAGAISGSAIKNLGGSLDYFSAPGLQLADNICTWSFWFKNLKLGPASGANYLINNCPGAPSGSAYAGINVLVNQTPNLVVMLGDNAGGVSSSNRKSLYYTDPSNWAGSFDWIHIVVIKTASGTSSQNVRVYYNGVLQTLQSESGLAASTQWSENIEPRFLTQPETSSSGQTPYKANPDSLAIDEMYYWNRVLTAEEVLDLYNDGSGLFYT